MKKPLGQNKISLLMIFAIALLLTIGLGFYTKSSSTKEQANFKLSLPSEKTVTINLDLNKQGLAKKLVQPNKVLITSGHRQGIVNKGNKPLWVTVTTTGLKGDVKLKSSDPLFDSTTGKLKHPLKPGSAFNLDVELSLSKGKNQKGFIKFIDSKTNKELGSVQVRVMTTCPSDINNSSSQTPAEGDCCE